MLLLTADMVKGEQEVVIYCELSGELNFHFFIEVRRPVSKAHYTQITFSKNDDFSDCNATAPLLLRICPVFCFSFYITLL